MRSIIEEISAAEARADEIRAEAAQTSREKIAAAHEAAERAWKTLDERERENTAAALRQAQLDSETISADVTNAMGQEADAVCEKARERVEDAVIYLLNKVLETK